MLRGYRLQVSTLWNLHLFPIHCGNIRYFILNFMCQPYGISTLLSFTLLPTILNLCWNFLTLRFNTPPPWNFHYPQRGEIFSVKTQWSIKQFFSSVFQEKLSRGNIQVCKINFTRAICTLNVSTYLAKNATLFQPCNNVVDVRTTLLQRQNDVVCLPFS